MWNIVAAVCLIAAAILWWCARVETAFVVATLGLVAWFLDQRNRLRRIVIERDGQLSEESEDIEEQDES